MTIPLPPLAPRPRLAALSWLTRAALFGAWLTPALLILTASSAWAQESAEVTALLDGAMDDYDMVMLDEAEEKLEQAVALSASEGVGGEPLARVFMMLGIVRFARDRDEAAAEQAFIAAIEASPGIALDPLYETPELAKIFARARANAKAGGGGASAASAEGFSHTPMISVEADQAMTLEADVSESLPVFRMFVYHRRFGEEGFQSAEMTPSSATRFSGVIPAELVSTSRIEYYIEALDRGGAKLAGAGSELEPIEVLVRGSEGSAGQVIEAGGEGNATDPVEAPEAPRDLVYVGVMGGTGVGFLPGGTPTARPFSGATARTVNPGVATTIAHTMLDLGWVINHSMRLGLYARYQFTPQQDFSLVPEAQKSGSFPSSRKECFGLGLSGDCLLGLKYRYYLSGRDPQAVRFYSSVGLGVGMMRHWVQLKENALLSNGQDNDECQGRQIFDGTDSAGNDVRYCEVGDTVRTGWGHFGLGGGVTVPIGEVVEFVADTYLMFHTLDQTSINLDLNAGFNLRF